MSETLQPWTPPRPVGLLATLHYACTEALTRGYEPQNFLLGTEAIKALDQEAASMRAYAFDGNCYATDRKVGGVSVVESKTLGPFAVVLIRHNGYLIDPVWLRR